MKKKITVAVSLCVLVWLAGVGFYQTHKTLPLNLNYLGQEFYITEDQIDFLYDLSWIDGEGEKHHKQEIFETIFGLIEGAERYILVDMFLFNSSGADDSPIRRNLSAQLTERLVSKKTAIPGITIDFITDPINTVYGGNVSAELDQLEHAGVNIIITKLEKLRDSNFIYSSLWRIFLQWFGNSPQNGWLPHPFSQDGEKVTLRSYLGLLNFKANHRKVMVADSGDDMVTVVGSANPHDGSSAHSNIALLVRGPIWRSVYQAEAAVASMSEGSLSPFKGPVSLESVPGNVRAQILTEQQIKKALMEKIDSSVSTDSIKIAQFYLADRDIVESLINAADRGAAVRLILDPNKDAFGYEKNGIPNRQTGHELVRRSGNKIQLRWYDTHGEQFHTKLFVSESGERVTVILGSANLTRRNLDNFNLELDIMLVFDEQTHTARSLIEYFNRIWINKDGFYTVGIEVYDDDSWFKRVFYRIQERFGLSTF